MDEAIKVLTKAINYKGDYAYDRIIKAMKLAIELITINKQEYDELVEASRILDALNAAGVDNWEGYEWVMRDLQ